MNSAGMKWFGWLIWLLTALGSIHLGLLALHYDLIEKFGLRQWDTYLAYIFGIAGVLSLLMMVKHIYYCSGHHDNCNCNCK